MVKVTYISESDNAFELSYRLHDYILDELFCAFPQHTEIHFLDRIFRQDPNFVFCGKFPLIWTMNYLWKLNGASFTISLDQDYDIIIFSVLNSEDRKFVADYIRNIIEAQHRL